MRMKKNKKGFSLVELMIVVVIMGILIAVAVPVYNVLVEKSERTVCETNQNTITTCFAKWVLMDAKNNASTLFLTDSKTFDGHTQVAEEVLDPVYIQCFEDKALPECPVEGHKLIIKRVNDEQIEVQCVEE